MTQAGNNPLRVVLYEGADSQALSADTRFELCNTLLQKGYAVTSAREDGAVTSADASPLLVLGQFQNDTPLEATTEHEAPVLFKNISDLDAQGVAQLVDDVGTELQARKPGGWKPWFPVIDYDRCTNCMQCLSFCLFDVYGVDDEDQIEVRNNNKCKTDCPACSRVCPEVAILFPKYRSGPINGDEVNDQDVEREKMKVDISSLLGGDIYKALRERSERAQSRFAKERDDARALKERQKCLLKLKEDLDIPDELLSALPTQEQIQEKAAEFMKSRTNGKANNNE